MKIIKGGFGKEDDNFVFSQDEQKEVDRINTEYRNKAAWYKVNQFIDYLKRNNKENEYKAAIKDRSDSDLLISKFSTGTLH